MEGLTRKQLEWKDKDELIDIILSLQSMVETLVDKVAMLEKEVSRLKRPATSRNSSLPPSKDLTRYPKRRAGGGKKSGGQYAHQAHTLEMPDSPDVIKDHYPSPYCPGCDRAFNASDWTVLEKRQVVDIPPVRSIVTEHRSYGVECGCGYCHKGAFPSTVKAPAQYGNNLSSLVCYLSARQFVPMARLAELIGSVTNISMSQGIVSNMLECVARTFLPLYDGIRDTVAGSAVVGGDETGLKVNGRKRWGWTWQTAGATYIAYSRTCGYDTMLEHFSEGFPGSVYVYDSLGAQLKTPPKAHQLCLAHITRELALFIEKDKSRWAGEMKEILCSAMELKKRMRDIDYL